MNYGQKITSFTRYATATRTGQARLPEIPYYAQAYVYDTSVVANITAFKNGLIVALYTGVDPSKIGLVAPFNDGDVDWGTPIGVILEANDLETDDNVSVYLAGGWDTSAKPGFALSTLDGPLDLSLPGSVTALARFHAKVIKGAVYWNNLYA